jgi:hypothetical protein
MTSVPDSSSRVVDDSGKVTTTWHTFLKSLVRDLSSVQTSINTITGAGGDDGEAFVAAGLNQTFAEAILIEYPTDKDYKFLAVGFTGEIEAVETETSSGSCTVTVLLDDVALGGGSSSVTSTNGIVAHGASNAVTPTTDIIIRVSSNSGAQDLSVTLRGTMTLS